MDPKRKFLSGTGASVLVINELWKKCKIGVYGEGSHNHDNHTDTGKINISIYTKDSYNIKHIDEADNINNVVGLHFLEEDLVVLGFYLRCNGQACNDET